MAKAAVGSSGKVKSRGPARANQHYQKSQRAHKGPKCVSCGRRLKTRGKAGRVLSCHAC